MNATRVTAISLALLLWIALGPGAANAACGNGVKEAGEACDGLDVGGQTCAGQSGFVAGTLSCADNGQCNTFSTQYCVPDLSPNSWSRLQSVPGDHWRPGSSVTDPPVLTQASQPAGRVYSGAAYGAGRIFYFGGGHNGYAGNDVEVYDVQSNRWTQSYVPEVCPSIVCVDPATDCGCLYGGGGTGQIAPSGRPYTEHTYSFFNWNPVRQRLFHVATSGATEFDLATMDWQVMTGPHAPGQPPQPLPPNTGAMHLMDWNPVDRSLQLAILSGGGAGMYRWHDDDSNDVWEWEDLNDANWPGNASAILYSSYDPDNDLHYVHCLRSGGCLAPWDRWWIYDPSTDPAGWTEMPNVPAGARDITDFDYDTNGDRLVGINTSGEIWAYNPANGSWTKQSGTAPAPDGGFHNNVHNPIFHFAPETGLFYYLYNDFSPNGGYPGAPDTELWAYRYASAQPAVCGNGSVEPGEVCDGADLGGQTCSTALGQAATGVLACAASCQSFDTSGCEVTPPMPPDPPEAVGVR